MIWLYRLFFLPVLLIAGPRYLLRMRKRGGYRKGFQNRFGFLDPLPPKTDGVTRIWIQAVSVGEMFAVMPLIRRLRESGQHEIFLTTTTSTGYALAREKLAEQTVGIAYFPLDFFLFSRRMWNRVSPDLCVLFEAEIWPEHLRNARLRNVPLLLINARMSDRSFGRLSRVSAVAGPLFNHFSRILAASSDDAERFLHVGADPERVSVSGNITLDVPLQPILTPEEIAQSAERLGLREPGKPAPLLIVGSSTWPGEETTLLRLLEKARAKGIDCKLLLVPRHAERRDEIARALEEFPAFTTHFRSAGQAPRPVDVAVGDSTGELILFTQLADLVFVGKSLPPNDGGQTPIEAAALGKPLLYGPFMTNFRQIARQLVDGGAAMVVGDEMDLLEHAPALLENEETRRAMSRAALAWHAANRGAVDKTLAAITALSDRQSSGISA